MSTANGWKPQAATRRIIEAAQEIIEAARAAGFRYTLRGVYYRLVARNLIPNSKPSYKRLTYVLKRARWEEIIAPDALDDVSRPLAVRPAWDSPAHALRSVAHSFRRDWWRDSPAPVEIWAEKAAVAAVLQPVAREYGVPFLACRGFLSLPAIVSAAARYPDRVLTLLYVGDFDPSGLQMDRDIVSRMERRGVDLTFRRLALTMEQVEAHRLPPNLLKDKDSRAANWPHKGSWELDALEPIVLSGLVRKAVDRLKPPDLAERQHRDTMDRANLHDLARQYEEGRLQ